LIARWQISAGEVTEWLPPLLYAAAVLVSAWVLFDARRRKFRFYAVAAWTLATLISTPIVLPLYLIARIFTQQSDAPTQTLDASTSPAHTQAEDSTTPAHESDDHTTPAPISNDTDEQAAATQTKETRLVQPRKLVLPLLYALALLSIGALYFYRDYHSFDAHLARAANARLLNERAAAIREYRAALRLSDDAHTRKLLAVQLAEDGQTEAALNELRAAERGGEPDALIPYRIAHALDALGRPAEADLEYQKFTRSSLCAHASPDARCAEAFARVQQRQGNLPPQ
jgi:tetratricopeptide (TPR) repeat protein